MKKLILAALAASVAASPVLAAPWDNGHNDNGRYEQRHDNGRDQHRHDDNGRYGRNDDRGGYDRHDDRRAHVEYRQWNRGQRFDSRYASNYRVIDVPGHYHLRPAPRGYRWVQSGNDAVMVGITTGLIAAVMANALN